MTLSFSANRKGFTLVELAIALGVVGLVVLGLFQLSTSTQRQNQDRQIAGQMRQMVDAVQNYLLNNAVSMAASPSDSAGQFSVNGKLKINEAGKMGKTNGQITNLGTYLPTSFDTSSYEVYIRRLNDINSAPNFQALILQNAQPSLNDKRGGSLASQIGAAGGFVYSDTKPAITGSNGGWLITNPTSSPASSPSGFNVSSPPTPNMLAALVTTPNLVLTSNMVSRVNTGNPEANTFRTSVALGESASLVLPPDGFSLAVGNGSTGSASTAYAGSGCGPTTQTNPASPDVTITTASGTRTVPRNSALQSLNALLAGDNSYFGRIILGRNSASATRADVLICRKNDNGTYTWKSMMESGVKGQAIVDSSMMPSNLYNSPTRTKYDMDDLNRSKDPPDAANGQCFWTRGVGSKTVVTTYQICPKGYYSAGIMAIGYSTSGNPVPDPDLWAETTNAHGCSITGCTAILCCPFD